MKKLLLFFLLIVVFKVSVGQKTTNRYGLWFIPSYANNIYGISIGILGSDVLCDKPYIQTSNGVNLQIIGQGIMQMFYIGNKSFINDFVTSTEYRSRRPVIHNGLLCSVFGTFTDEINGISISPFMSMNGKVNGVSANLLWNMNIKTNGCSIGIINHSAQTNGIQIGLFNRATRLNGLQIGLWNVNAKRSLPIINWSFNRKKK